MNFFNQSKTLATAAAVAMLVAMPLAAQASADKPGEGTTVQMARATWTTGFFPAEIYKQLVEKLGYEVEMTTLANPAFFRSVGLGDVDFWVNGWFPLHSTYAKAFKPGAKKIGYVVKNGALQGYLMSKALVDKYDIKYVSDVARPEVNKALDSDGDGKAELVACPPGWGCEKVISYQLKNFDWGDTVEPIMASYSASMADAIAQFKNGEPIFFYTWTPNWTVGILKPGKDVMWVPMKKTDLPPAQDQFEDATTVPHLKGCAGGDPCNLGWVANDIRAVANKEFLKKNPAIAALLKAAHIPIADIFAQNAEMFHGADEPEDITRQASEWIEAHQDWVNDWLKQAREAAAG